MASPLKLALVSAGRPAWQVAAEAGLSPTKLSHLATGRHQATADERAALARVLSKPISELFPAAAESRAA